MSSAAAPAGHAPLWVVVLAGGVGSRFWPLSTPARPKQLLPLVTSAPMLTDTLARLAALAPPDRTLILTSARLQAAVQALCPDLPPENVIAEPFAVGTCAALTWAAAVVASRAGAEAPMVCVHADWAIGDVAGYQATLAEAAAVAAARHALVTVGIVPTRPDPGFGYIQPGAAVDGGVWAVERFVEKPDRARAAQFVADGFLWNSGIFAWRAGDLLAEVDALTPEVAPALRAAGGSLEAFCAGVRSPVAIDVGVMERSRRVLVLRGDFGWDDVGTWGALHHVRAHDGAGNALHGAAFALEAHDNVVHAEDSRVILYGVADLVVVAQPGRVLVTTRDKAAELKGLLDALPPGFATS
jgi:mannose-1-phosphate guanylyltransferase